jgi:DNA-binding transcriptional regulator YhcF (GntR family)
MPTITSRRAVNPPAPEAAGKETLASSIYDQLRQDILTVEFPADAKLNIRALCERFDVGLSPVREALSRLSRENLVRQADHRGFTVAPLSKADLHDLTKARCALDGMALRQSIEARDAAWEEQLLISYHRLSRTPRFSGADAKMRSPAWEEDTASSTPRWSQAAVHGVLLRSAHNCSRRLSDIATSPVWRENREPRTTNTGRLWRRRLRTTRISPPAS